MNENAYSKRKVNMMRVNALRSEGSIAKSLFISYLAGIHVLDFDGHDSKKYPSDYFTFKKIIKGTPSIEKLHAQINTYRAAEILKLLGTSVDNKKLGFLTSYKDPLGTMSNQDLLDIIKVDLEKYKLLLDAFICHRHRKAIRRLRFKIKKELDMSNEDIRAYKIVMTMPNSLLPFIHAYQKLKKEQDLEVTKIIQN